MDWFRRRILKEFEDMERHMGRMMRNMSLSNMAPYQSGGWFPATDVCETDNDIVVMMDVSGIEPDELTVIADERSVTVSGDRKMPQLNVEYVHQLEIERGFLKRTVPLPVSIDISNTTYFCKNGFVVIKLPKRQQATRLKINIS